MSYMIIDLETSISNTIHGPSGVCPSNDFYTLIYKKANEEVEVIHKKGGFHRKLPISLEGIDILVGHNIKFDLLYFWEDAGFQEFLARGGYIYDTQLGEYLLTGQRHKMSSLAELQLKYLGGKKKLDKISYLFKKGIGADKIINKKGIPRIHRIYHEYARLDGITTEQVFLRQYKKIKTSGMWPIVKLYNKYLLVLTMMEHNGMPFDLDLVERKSTEYKLKGLEYLRTIRELVVDIWNDPRLPEFNPNSGDHLSAVLFGGTIKVKERVQQGFYKNGNPKMKVMELPYRIDGLRAKARKEWASKKAGVYSTDKTVLGHIANQSNKAGKLASLILESRVINKLASTYFPSYLERQLDGNVHPTYRNTQTITGRLSCSNPNFQNIPKGGEVESLISPHEPGWTCVSIDYSQLEVYILAFSSGCDKLAKQLAAGLDLHCKSLSFSVKESYEEIMEMVKTEDEWKEKRKKIGKGITFGIQYAQSTNSLAKGVGISKDEAADVLTAYYEEYPEIKNFFDTIRDNVESSSCFGKAVDLSSMEQKLTKNGRRFKDGLELLPVKDWDSGNNTYSEDFMRHVGYFNSFTGRKYSYDSDGSSGYDGIREVFRQPIIQNYAIQGTAGDVQGASSVSMFESLLKHGDKIKLINEIHDSKWFIIKDEYLSALLPKVVYHMEEGFKKVFKDILGINFDAELKVDVEVGPNFANLKEIEVKR